MPSNPEPHYDPDGYLRARVEFLAEQVALLRTGVQDSMREVRSEVTRQEERFKVVVGESEKRAVDRMEQLNKSLAEQNLHLRDALREDRQQWIDANKAMQHQFLQTTQVLEQKYQTLVPLQRTVLMILGALVLLGYLAKPIIEKVFK